MDDLYESLKLLHDHSVLHGNVVRRNEHSFHPIRGHVRLEEKTGKLFLLSLTQAAEYNKIEHTAKKCTEMAYMKDMEDIRAKKIQEASNQHKTSEDRRP